MSPRAKAAEPGDIRIEYMPLDEILRWPRNPKLHDAPALDGSIGRFGFNDPLTVDEGTGHLVEGHGRLEAPKVAVVQPGELWILGEHRLLCGDSTEPSAVGRLMAGATAKLLSTDPPYGVAYGEARPGEHGYEPIANDENDGPRLEAFLTRVFAAMTPHLEPNAPWYIWHAFLTYRHFAAAIEAAGITIKQQIIWCKPSLVLGRNDFHWQHEPWYSDRKQTTVWNVGRENDKIHPTQKPVELFTRPMGYSTVEGEVCLEPFSGSGSQIIAAERAARRCYALELDPKYCDVAIERWERITGGKAKRT